MRDPSHNSSSRYTVDRQKYSDNWNRIFGNKELIHNSNTMSDEIIEEVVEEVVAPVESATESTPESV